MTIAAALLGAVAPPALAGATLRLETDEWIRAKTAHFVLYSNASERRTLDLGRRLERFRATLARFNKKFVVDPPVVTSLFIFKDDASLTPYKTRFNGRPVEMSGLFVGRPDGNATRDLTLAQEMFTRTIQLRQGFAEAYVEFARVLIGQGGEPGPAMHVLEAVRALLPSRIDIVTNLALLYARKGDTARARDLVENVLERMNDRRALEQARRLLQQEEGRRAAIRSDGARPTIVDTRTDGTFEPAEGLPPEPAEDYNDRFSRHLLIYNQAVALANKRDYKGAIALLENLLKQEKDENLRAETSAFLERLRADAARLRKSGG